MRERGHKLLRRQTDEQLAGYDGTASAEANRIDVLTARAEAAEKELADCRRALASSRVALTADRETLAEVRADRDRIAEMLTAANLSALALRRNWERASALLRLLTPEEVHGLRRMRDAGAV